MAGQWFKPFGLTIACSVLVSLFVSFSLDPMLSAYWPDKHGPLHTRWFISRWLGYFNLWFDRQAERYKSVIAWALDHRYSMLALALASFIGALALPATGVIPAALVRRLRRRRGRGVRHPQVHRLQHHRRGQRGAREGRGSPA